MALHKETEFADAASALTELLSMPVKFVACDSTMRCLEMRLSFNEAGTPHCTLAFRTDPDRQGESSDVVSWPQPDDPRTRMLLGALISGLAAKVRFYCRPGVSGFTATIRRMCQFVAAAGCHGTADNVETDCVIPMPDSSSQMTCLSRNDRK